MRYFIKLRKVNCKFGLQIKDIKYSFLKVIHTVCILDILTTYDRHLNKIAAS